MDYDRCIGRINRRGESIMESLDLPPIQPDADKVKQLLAETLAGMQLALVEIKGEMELALLTLQLSITHKHYNLLEGQGKEIYEANHKRRACEANIAQLTASHSSIVTTPLRCFTLGCEPNICNGMS